jgi:2-polyprenyl-3-methyl-5-hydroxy-6-metoxy-1,4-benzoquinol methylase
MESKKQADFYSCYRGRQSFIFHLSYLRLRKVWLFLLLLEKSCINLEKKRFLDYAFGSGTLFRFLPQDCFISGVEIDTVAVEQVSQMLKERGYKNYSLRFIDVKRWQQNEIWKHKYDIICASHVLEHLLDPSKFLHLVSDSLETNGHFIGLVPINEIIVDSHHEKIFDKSSIYTLCDDAGLEVVEYIENDHFTYWLQPIFSQSNWIAQFLRKVVCLWLGCFARLLPPKFWFFFSSLVGKMFFCRPTQAAFLARRR